MKCPVRSECLEFAFLTMQKHGVWGGTSEQERRRLRLRWRARLTAEGGSVVEPPPSDLCGSNAGHRAHYRRGEQPCEPCRVANARYRADRSAWAS